MTIKMLNLEVSEDLVRFIDSLPSTDARLRNPLVQAALDALRRVNAGKDDRSPEDRMRDAQSAALHLALESLDVIATEPASPSDGIDYEKHNRMIAQFTAAAIRKMFS